MKTFPLNKQLTSEEANGVASEILKQLGGAGFIMMVGASTFSSHREGRGALSFRFKGSKQANYLKVILTPDDLYTLQFWKVGEKTAPKEVEEVEGIYFDSLHDVFKRVTGLEPRMPKFLFRDRSGIQPLIKEK